MSISRLQPWAMRNWMIGVTAVFSLFMFTATSYIPVHRVTGIALISSQGGQDIISAAENHIQELFDNIAAKHGLHCMICDPLSKGRLYVKNEADPSSFALVANLDVKQGTIFYDASSIGHDADKNASDIDMLQTEIERQLQTHFSNVKIEKGKRPRGATVQLGVRKKNSGTSYKAQENQDDYDKAIKCRSDNPAMNFTRFTVQRAKND